MADCHSTDAGKRCPQPCCRLKGLSTVPLSQRLQGVLDAGTEPQRPDSTRPCHLPPLSFSWWCWKSQNSTSPCRCTPCKYLAWQEGTGCCPFLARSLTLCHAPRPRCRPAHPSCLAGCRIRPLGTLLGPGPLACIPLQTAAAALWTFTFPSLKLKTSHITKLRAPKISGGKHYCEQKPGGLFSRGWLLFQSVLASIIFPSTGILGYWGA